MLEMHELIPGAKHFYVYEAACGDGCGYGRHPGDVSTDLIDLLEAVRTDTGRPLVVNSMCRCKAHNKAEGGVEDSVHTLGEGADIKAFGGERKHGIEKAGYKHGATGVGTGGNFIHLDVHDGSVKHRPSSWGY
jgi:uncharacterized protein YcbK (DUF882 family)